MIARTFCAVLVYLSLGAALAEPAPQPVRVAALSTLALYPEKSAPATVVSDNETVLKAEIAARVEALPPRVGDVVDPGGLVARLDCRDYRLALTASGANVDVLEARIALAERKLERASALESRQSLAIEVLDERRADLSVLTAELAAARARVEADEVAVGRCTIAAPFRAAVLERHAPPGSYAAIGDPVARVVDVENLELSALAALADVDELAAADRLEFAAAGSRYPVKLRTLVPAVNTKARNREARLVFTGERPLSGAAGQLVWRHPEPHVPGRALVRREDELGIFVVDGERARFVPLPAAEAGRASPVALPGDARVIVEGQFALTDGAPVLVEAP